MAQRRMFSPDIVEGEEFISMPDSSQNLYFHLGMNADDDGFIQPKLTMRKIGSNDDDLKILLAKRFLLGFGNGVVVVKHWLIHNLIRTDRYKPTRFLDERNSLIIKENKAYTEKDKLGLQNDNQLAPQVRLGKVRLGEDSNTGADAPVIKKFIKPALEEIKAYCDERKNRVNPEVWLAHYESNGWKVGRNSMKDWKAAVRTWENNKFEQAKKTTQLIDNKSTRTKNYYGN